MSPIRLPVLAAIVASALIAAACSSSPQASTALEDCERSVPEGWSVARVWDEAVLDAIRRDFPAPTVHARNLFHASAAMWDAWAAYDRDAAGYFVDESKDAADVEAAREEAMSYAVYRVMTSRYSLAIGADESLRRFDETMAALCFPTDFTATEGEEPAAFGNAIAAAIIDASLNDGSLEALGYFDPTHVPVNDPLIVTEPGAEMVDPNRWQPLALDTLISQNDTPVPWNVQEFVGPQWGFVRPFALEWSESGLPLDPGDPPYLGDPETDEEFKEAAVEVIRFSSILDPSDDTEIDISPATIGNAPLGTYDDAGYDVNPITGEQYAANVVSRADFGRVVAEFWADGPDSETPPGHWNTFVNEISDLPGLEHRFGGEGPELDRLEWDVKVYFALNGAMHDAAVAGWGAKAYYDYVRPISMIRYMGGLGQSSDPAGISYDPEGLPLIDGLVEVITPESSAVGERHEHLAEFPGEVAIYTWVGNPADPEVEVGGVGWIRAVEWVPYQKPTFVTPAFAAYVSGHSAFSRAGAEVMTAVTGSPYFPDGLGEWTIPAGWLAFEAGPEEDLTLQWATYYDAADQAGLSRLYGGIHVRADDLRGRVVGSECGQRAWDLAVRYFDGTIRG